MNKEINHVTVWKFHNFNGGTFTKVPLLDDSALIKSSIIESIGRNSMSFSSASRTYDIHHGIKNRVAEFTSLPFNNLA